MVAQCNKDSLWLYFASAPMNPHDFNPAFNCHNIVIYVDFYAETSKLNFHNKEVKSQTGPDSSINHMKAMIFLLCVLTENFMHKELPGLI